MQVRGHRSFRRVTAVSDLAFILVQSLRRDKYAEALFNYLFFSPCLPAVLS